MAHHMMWTDVDHCAVYISFHRTNPQLGGIFDLGQILGRLQFLEGSPRDNGDFATICGE